MNLSLEGKNAVVCGSTQGIGYAVAEELALLGANCTLIARNEAALKEAVHNLDIALRQQHNYIVADFNNTDEVKKAIEEQVAKHAVHILINNTGGPSPGPIVNAGTEEFENAFRQHLINNHNLAQAVLPGMQAAGYGRIINIISTSVRIPLQNLGVSNTIRAAVASWAKTLSNEVAQFGITVNNILPGLTDTKRLNDLIAAIAKGRGLNDDVIRKEMINTVPAKRLGNAEEIANVVAFLASPAASYVNGISIPVDGGRTGTI
jgi:3-oxoacyl-[acyl-carrier protein] reductase